MRKNAVVVPLVAVILVLVVVVMGQHLKLREMRAGEGAVAEQTRDVVEPRVDAAEVKHAEPESSMHHMERREYEETIAALQSRLEEREAEEESPEEPAPPKSPLAGLAEMMKDPGMKDMIRAQQEGMMDASHGSLFQYLDLPPEELDALKKLLVEKQMALVDYSFELMDGSVTPERRKELAETIGKVSKEYDEQIKDFLGEEDYEIYKDFEATQQERMQVNMFKQTLAADDQLSDQQEHDLIRAMHDEKASFDFTVDLEDEQTVDPAIFTEKAVGTYIEEMSKLHEQHLARASTILSPRQLEQFKASQKQMRAMQEMGMKMASKMFGGGEAGASDSQ